MSGREDGFRFFLRHEKEGDGADDVDDDDSDEDEHDGERARGVSSPQGQISRIEVIAYRRLTPLFLFCDPNRNQRAPFGHEFRNLTLNISYRFVSLSLKII